MRHGLRILWPALVLVAALLVSAPARAATYPVTTIKDTVPGQQPCLPGDCSLRAALAAAGATNGEADLIQVPAGTYTLTNGALTVPRTQTDITLAGAGASATIISGNAQNRVLDIEPGAEIAISGVTLREGLAAGADGGNVLVGTGARVTLAHTRVTAGTALRGGGIAGTGAQLIEIANSVIDNNAAEGTEPSADGGGGIWVDGTSGTTALLVQDSTVAFNRARDGGGIGVSNNASGTMRLLGVTVASNQASPGPGGGLLLASPTGAPVPLHVGGSIVARNTGGGAPSNCGGVPPLDDGGNVESGVDCGLAAAKRQNTDPQLSSDLLDAGGQTPLFTLAPTSPAIDIATCTTTTDQRDVARPQGPACDAGAYEFVPAPLVVDPPPQDPPRQLVPPPPATPVPVAKRSVVGTELRGRVLVRLPGTKRFVNLNDVRSLPLGTVVNATAGRVRITSAADAKGRTQTAVFYDGIFKIGQTGPRNRLTTVLTLFGNKPRCAKAKPRAKRAESSRRRGKKRNSRRLWGNGRGRFRTKGQYSSATVRGTKWLVQDSCKGTLTRVARGRVSVRDFVRRKTVTVKAGRHYLAKPRR